MSGSSIITNSRILIVEDEHLQALDIASILEAAGAQVIGPTATLEEAARLKDECGCDAVVLDLRVGGHKATSFARSLMKDRVPFIIQTGYPDSIFLKPGWPGCRIILKPIQQDELMLILEDILNWKRSGELTGHL